MSLVQLRLRVVVQSLRVCVHGLSAFGYLSAYVIGGVLLVRACDAEQISANDFAFDFETQRTAAAKTYGPCDNKHVLTSMSLQRIRETIESDDNDDDRAAHVVVVLFCRIVAR